MTEPESEAVEFPLPGEVELESAPLTYDHPDRPPRNSFLAWHRPRKQYVREKQWTNAVRQVMDGRDPDDKLKYIGLPGIDLLDLRQILRTVCEPTERKLQYIGFDITAGSDSSSATELNISESELDARVSVHSPSGVRPDDLRYLGMRSTAAWRAVRKFGHVDVVNFDLTTTLFDGSPDDSVSYLSALKEILALQSGNTRPWVLLLTTRVDRQDMTDEAIGPLLAQFRDSLEDCAPLQAAISEAELTVPDSLAIAEWDDDSLRVTSLAAMLQWVHGLLNDGSISARVRLVSCFVYTSFQGSLPDMASMVVRFEPLPTDLQDAVFPGAEPDETDEADEALANGPCVQFARQYQRIAMGIDIDERLHDDLDLRSAMTELAADLLEEARYSRDDYLAWAATQSS